MNQLPKHIADMCGIATAKTQSQASSEEFQAVTTEIDEDDDIQINYRGEIIGWIFPMKPGRSHDYRAMTRRGTLGYFHTQSSAMNWLIEEAF